MFSDTWAGWMLAVKGAWTQLLWLKDLSSPEVLNLGVGRSFWGVSTWLRHRRNQEGDFGANIKFPYILLVIVNATRGVHEWTKWSLIGSSLVVLKPDFIYKCLYVVNILEAEQQRTKEWSHSAHAPVSILSLYVVTEKMWTLKPFWFRAKSQVLHWGGQSQQWVISTTSTTTENILFCTRLTPRGWNTHATKGWIYMIFNIGFTNNF